MITGKGMKKMREEAHISQTELARLANVSQAHIAKIETEKVNPRLSTVNTLMSILQKSRSVVRCRDVMSRKIISIRPGDTAKKAVGLMKSFDISQMPVMDRGRVVGSVSESTILRHLDKNLAYVRVSDIMEAPFPAVDEDDSSEMIPDILEYKPAVLVSARGRITGIITKFDLLGAR